MPEKPHFSYFLAHPQKPVSASSPIWQEPLPLSRNLCEMQLKKKEPTTVTHGDYFQAAQSFLEINGFEMLIRAVGRRLKQDIGPKSIEKIRIFLEKHGEFYHPARIEVILGGRKISFVLNVAISQRGLESLQDEYFCLNKLTGKHPFSYLPQVYGRGEVGIKGAQKVRMFLGDWFDEYCEFHISRDGSDQKNKILVWDSERGNFFLSSEQSLKLYTQAAKILTCYYDLESFEQIISWHHAAGDFIVKVEHDKVDLKLIAVRRHASVFKSLNDLKCSGKEADLILQALLIFLVNLSIRMRLDRLDGVGAMVWADESAVLGTLRGLFEGLALKPRAASLPDSPQRCFVYYLSLCTEADLLDLSKTLVNSFNPRAPEIPVVKKHLKEHVHALHQALNSH